MDCPKEKIEEEIEKYNSQDGEFNYNLVKEYFNIELYIEIILN